MINNVTRLLDAKKVPYQVFELPVEKLGAKETATLLNLPVEQIYKTIVVARPKPGKPLLAVVPGDRQVDLKALAQVVNEKKLFLSSEKEAELLTGLLAGGISPLALINKGFQVVIDNQAEKFTEIHISGGARGLNIRLPVSSLVQLTHARLAAISSLMQE